MRGERVFRAAAHHPSDAIGRYRTDMCCAAKRLANHTSRDRRERDVCLRIDFTERGAAGRVDEQTIPGETEAAAGRKKSVQIARYLLGMRGVGECGSADIRKYAIGPRNRIRQAGPLAVDLATEYELTGLLVAADLPADQATRASAGV